MSLVRPEDQLVLCAARPSLDTEADENIRALLGQELNWLELLISANRQGVIPLLEKNLAHRKIPDEIANELRNWKQEIFTFNLFLSGELIKLLDLLSEHGVDAIPFKGPALTLQVHGDVGLRQYKDLDILVRKNDVAKVCQLLRDEGFQPALDVTPSQESASLRFGCALTLKDPRGVIVDVHWRMGERHLGIELSTDEFWIRREPVNIGNRTLLTLSAEDLLLVLCCHGYAHSWDRLAWICDVGILLERRKDLGWSYVLDRARSAGVQQILLFGLAVAQESLRIKLPDEASRELDGDTKIWTEAKEVTARLFTPHDRLGRFDLLSRHLRMRERTRDKLTGLFAMVAMPREYDWMFLSVPAPLYYLIRPLRWAVTIVRGRTANAEGS